MAGKSLNEVQSSGTGSTYDSGGLKDYEAKVKLQEKIRTIREIQERNRKLRDAKGKPKHSEVDDGRGIKSVDALRPGSTGGKSKAKTEKPAAPKVIDLSNDPDAKDLGGTYGDGSETEKTAGSKPWEPRKESGSYVADFKTKEFKEQWFRDQMEELGFKYDPKASFKAHDPAYDAALRMARSNWNAMTVEWEKRFNAAVNEQRGVSGLKPVVVRGQEDTGNVRNASAAFGVTTTYDHPEYGAAKEKYDQLKKDSDSAYGPYSHVWDDIAEQQFDGHWVLHYNADGKDAFDLANETPEGQAYRGAKDALTSHVAESKKKGILNPTYRYSNGTSSVSVQGSATKTDRNRNALTAVNNFAAEHPTVSKPVVVKGGTGKSYSVQQLADGSLYFGDPNALPGAKKNRGIA